MSKKKKNLTRKEYWAKYRQEIKTMKFAEKSVVKEVAAAPIETSNQPNKVLLTSQKRGTHELIEEYEKTHRKNNEVIDEKEFKAVKIIATILLLALLAFLIFYMTKEIL